MKRILNFCHTWWYFSLNPPKICITNFWCDCKCDTFAQVNWFLNITVPVSNMHMILIAYFWRMVWKLRQYLISYTFTSVAGQQLLELEAPWQLIILAITLTTILLCCRQKGKSKLSVPVEGNETSLVYISQYINVR